LRGERGVKGGEQQGSRPVVRRSGSKPLPATPPHDPELPLARLGWIRRPQLTALEKLGITTLRGLLEHYPRRHEDRRRFDRFPDAEGERTYCLSGTVGKTVFRRFGRMRSFEAQLREGPDSPLSAVLTLRWFNLFHVQKTVLAGSRLIVHGKVRLRGKRLCMEHPEFEIVTQEDRESIHLDRIVPVHPAGEGISVRVIRDLIHRALAECNWSCWNDPLGGRDVDWDRALRSVHFPTQPEEIEPARRSLALRELLGIQTLVTIRRQAVLRPRGTPKKVSGALLGRCLDALPFTPTAAQKRAVDAIRADMERPHRMHRLLQGDVGSGKTLVAAASMLLALEAGHRVVLMAPTQILAGQHFRTFETWFSPLGIPVTLVTSSGRKTSSSRDDRPVAVIGTHALLHDDTILDGAGLVVIDEQHKFGVLQRARLATLPSAPDVLVMTATPIPRTLARTLHGDLDLSVLDERPPGRGVLRTAARGMEKLPEIVDYMRARLEMGRQAYVVYPLVEQSEKLTAKAAEEEIARWGDRLAPIPCALLHGKMKPSEKEAVMESFRTGKTRVLVTTSVIEVGVDIPNATLLLVENAERFGLAQLHQLRGRIGRGEHASTCILLEGSGSPEALERLRILERSDDGFVIAEEDLRLRGAGDILGTEQSGLPPLRLVDLHRDADLLPVAAAEAARILGEDPLLELPNHAPLRRLREAHTVQLLKVD
jgi:ATP-dependent DNA helicase RecG